MYYTTTHPSPVGLLTLASDGESLVGLWLAGQKYHGGTIAEPMTANDTLPLFATVKSWLDKYFAGETPAVSDLPLAPIGSDFRQNVWQILLEIPHGSLLTYGEIARKLAERTGRASMSAQAVGGAVGHNPISIIIPCHRVVGSGGSLTGYAGGIAAKLKLLELEGADTAHLTIPTRGTAL